MRSLVQILLAFFMAGMLDSRASEEAGDIPLNLGHGRILIVSHNQATVAFKPQTNEVIQTVHAGIKTFTGRTNLAEAWRSLVNPADVIGIKVYAAPGPASGTRKPVVEGIIRGLQAAGIPSTNIIIWDKRLADLRLAGWTALAETLGVQVLGAVEEGFAPEHFYETPLLGRLVFGDLEFEKNGDGVGRRSHASRLVTSRLTRIINVSPLLNHNLTGVAGCLGSLTLGSVDNTIRFESDPPRLASAIPEIYALPAIGDKVVLNVTDALIAQYQGEERSLLHYAAVLNELWFSKDPVALDLFSLETLDAQRKKVGIEQPKFNRDIYSNAALLSLGMDNRKEYQIERLILP
ncbi:MAG: DUF362 domain-containing protein [Verrucomicrobiota bacterium]|nr:DUF362 domain-containing protein [Verrucomicrobiota bacterium]